jgi:hypothetical protein
MNRSAVFELPVAESHAGRVERAPAPAYPLLEDFQFAGIDKRHLPVPVSTLAGRGFFLGWQLSDPPSDAWRRARPSGFAGTYSENTRT